MDEVLKGVAALLAVVATAVGIAAAVEQLTLPARLRRTAAWSWDSASREVDATRKQALEHLGRVATARLVASQYVPIVYFVAPTAMTVALVTVTAVASVGPPLEDSTNTRIALAAVSVVGLVINYRRAIRVYLARQRIATEYLSPDTPISPPKLDVLDQMEGGTSEEFGHAVLLAICTGLWVLGLSLLLSVPPGLDWLPVLSLILGGSLFALPQGRLRQRSVAYQARTGVGES